MLKIIHITLMKIVFLGFLSCGFVNFYQIFPMASLQNNLSSQNKLSEKKYTVTRNRLINTWAYFSLWSLTFMIFYQTKVACVLH